MTPTAELTIGQVAALSRLTIRALRHYDEIGLLPPARVDPSSGYRYYLPAQVTTASTIAVLRSLDIDIATIRQVLRDGADVQVLIEQERSRLQSQIDRTTAALSVLDTFEGLRDSGPRMSTERIESFTILGEYLEAAADDDIEVVAAAFDRLFGELNAAEVGYDPDGVCVIHRSDRDTLALDIGVRAVGVADLNHYRSVEIAGGLVATTIHQGPLASLPLGHARLATWALEQGLRPDGSPRETYLGDLADQRTRIDIPVTRP